MFVDEICETSKLQGIASKPGLMDIKISGFQDVPTEEEALNATGFSTGVYPINQSNWSDGYAL